MKTQSQQGRYEKELSSGLIRLHVLHHATEEGVFGLGMIEELARHGYKLSPGTLYPLLHRLETKGLFALLPEERGRKDPPYLSGHGGRSVGTNNHQR